MSCREKEAKKAKKTINEKEKNTKWKQKKRESL
jgi:hypothetical protein